MDFSTEVRVFFSGLILGLLLALASLFFTQGGPWGLRLRVEAVKSGAAYWKVNEHGETTFTWKHLENKPENPK